jgi:Putative phage tail protein
MATIVLTAVGNIFGGPIGGAIGAIVGQQIDGAIFGNGKPREGPRLKELDVQTSSYGNSIPAIFGAMRVAGTVIWASDLIERKTKSGGGKGKPSTINYSYSVNMAVALSSRPLARIGRIWADGNLLRGAAGDFKVETGFRLYSGHCDQIVDPLIASAESAGQAPAHRGLAYVVFEDLQLADFGNRIPSLTFEVFEREALVPLNDIAEQASGSLITGHSAEMLTGYALYGRDVRDAIAPLLGVMPVLLRVKDDRLELNDYWSNASTLSINHAAKAGSQTYDRPSRHLISAAKIPASLSLRHYEPMRDYQTGVQRSSHAGSGRIDAQVELPVAISANSARRLADLQLLRSHRKQATWTGHVVLDEYPVSVGDWVLDDKGAGKWRVTELEHMRGVMRFAAVRDIDAEPGASVNSDPGRNTGSPDIATGATRIMAIDLPVLTGTDTGKPVLAIAAAGTTPGWRRAALSVRQGVSLIDIGRTANPAVMGNVIGILPPHNPQLVDYQTVLEVQLLHDGMQLLPGTGDILRGDNPVCWVEGELVRYASAFYLGGAKYRLTGLQRGCFGSEDAVTEHIAGNRFLLLDSATLRGIDDIPLNIGKSVEFEAFGLGDIAPVSATVMVGGRAVRPLPPVHLAAAFNLNGSIGIRWTRRSRIDFGWNDGVDQPLVEDSESYEVEMIAGGTSRASWIVGGPAMSVPAQELAQYQLASGTMIRFEISQIGRYARSSVASTIPLMLP